MTHPTYVAVLSHVSPDGDDHLLAEGESKTRSLRVLRTAMKELGRKSGLSFYVHVIKNRHPNAPCKPATDHHFRCLDGKGRRHRRGCR